MDDEQIKARPNPFAAAIAAAKAKAEAEIEAAAAAALVHHERRSRDRWLVQQDTKSILILPIE